MKLTCMFFMQKIRMLETALKDTKLVSEKNPFFFSQFLFYFFLLTSFYFSTL